MKIIVADGKGKEFYRHVAISRTNSGLRPDEFNLQDNQYHTFETVFDILDNKAVTNWDYSSLKGKTVHTNYATKMEKNGGRGTVTVDVLRLTTMVIKDVQTVRGSNKAKLTLVDLNNKTKYFKEVVFRNTPEAANLSNTDERIYENLFSDGDPFKTPGVRKENMIYIRKGQIRQGFNEAEVRLSRSDEPTSIEDEGKTVVWTFSNVNMPFARVIFDKATMKVTKVTNYR